MFPVIILASHNRKKTAELQTILAALGSTLKNLADFPDAIAPDETGATFAENAVIKAEAAREHTGFPCLADDSGLVVDALGGAPGIYSARYAGPGATDEDNNRLLLRNMADIRGDKRTAHFACVIALAVPGRETLTFSGAVHGRILYQPDGAGGFGYDPLFFSDELGVSFAQAPAEEKNRISHRGRALVKLADWLEEASLE